MNPAETATSAALRVRDAFDVPAAETLRAGGWVASLAAAPSAAEAAALVQSWVMTPKVRSLLPNLLRRLGHALREGNDDGTFVHGSFGSGKSHLMGVLGLLLEGRPEAWARPDLAALCHEARAWVDEGKPLVVRVHMLSAHDNRLGFDAAVYQAVQAALQREGLPAVALSSSDKILAEMDKEAQAYGAAFFQRLEADGVTDSEAQYRAQRHGSREDQDHLAAAWLEATGRDGATLHVEWAEGLQRIARHLHAHGRRALVLMIDEFLLWLGQLSTHAFKQAIHQLLLVVDHPATPRPIATFAFVARQRNIQEFFPDLARDAELYSYLDHQSGRFQTLMLEDVELRHVARERVLKRRAEAAAALEAVLAKLSEQHRDELPALLQDGDLGYLRDVYPFHPALVEALIDVSSLMQRDRTALRLLSELLVEVAADLPLGELVPVGRAFEAVFPRAGIETDAGGRDGGRLRQVHDLYWSSMRPSMDAMRHRAGDNAVEAGRVDMLDALVKTALLAEVSPRLKRNGLTVERLVQLNDADVAGESRRGKMGTAARMLTELARERTELSVSGTSQSAGVTILLQGADFGRVLERARGECNNEQARARAFFGVFVAMLGLDASLATASSREQRRAITWRGTKRQVLVRIANVRLLPEGQFAPPPGCEALLLLDYPWDDPGHTVEEDRQRVEAVRKSKGQQWTGCWLPRHLSEHELQVAVDIAAAERILGDTSDSGLLGAYGPADRKRIRERAVAHKEQMVLTLQQTIRNAYVDRGDLAALCSDVSPRVQDSELTAAIERLAGRLLDRRYPAHPTFPQLPTPALLEVVAKWGIEAYGALHRRVTVDQAQRLRIEQFAQPLEMVQLGQETATLRDDGRFFGVVAKEAQSKDTFEWDVVTRPLAEVVGLQPVVLSTMLRILAEGGGFYVGRPDAKHGWQRVTIDSVADTVPAGLHLRRAELLTPSEWSRLREVADALFGPQPSGESRTPAGQDALRDRLKVAATDCRAAAAAAHTRLAELGFAHVASDAGPATSDPRAADLRDVQTRLARLVKADVDAYDALTAFLKAWPDDAEDPVRAAARRVEAQRDALQEVASQQIAICRGGLQHAGHGGEAQRLLDQLGDRLRAREAAQPLTSKVMRAWTADVHALNLRLIAEPPPERPPVERPPVERPPVERPPQEPPPQDRPPLAPLATDTEERTTLRTLWGSSAAVSGKIAIWLSTIDSFGDDDEVDIEITVRKRGEP